MVMQYEDFKRLNSDNDDGGGVKVMSVQRWGARTDATPDANTNGITNAIKWLRGGSDRALLFPDAHYKLAGPIKIGESSADVITGLRMYGQSSGGTVLEQTVDNTAIFELNAQWMHTCEWENFSVTYTNPQTGPAGSVFKHVGSGATSMYMCSWKHFRGDNFYWFMYAPDTLWWGNSYEDFWLGDFKGGVNFVTGAAGEPNCKFDRIYITCQSAVEVLFRHEAMTATYDNIEVNAANSGAGMLYDGSGGTHIIGHWALEGAIYPTGRTLFEVPNGTLLAQYVYTEKLSCPAGQGIIVYSCGGARSFINVRYHSIQEVAADNAGTILMGWTDGPRKIRFGDLIVPFSNKLLLSDMGNTAEHIVVDSWNDGNNIDMLGDADVVLTESSSVNQVFGTAITAARVVTLPEARNQVGTNLFSGRRFRVARPKLLGAYAITIKDKQGATVASIASNLTGEIELVWHRTTGWYVQFDSTQAGGGTSGSGATITNGVLPIDGTAGTFRGVQVKKAGKNQWGIGGNQSDAFTVDRYDTAGNFLESSFSIDPVTGVATFAKSPTLPDVATVDYSQKGISSKFFWDAFFAQAATTLPKQDGTASSGSSQSFARADHVHPTDATRAPIDSPTFTGIPKGDTAASGTSTKQLATTEFVMGEVAKVSGGTASNGNVTYTTKNVTYFKTPGAQTWTPPAEFFSLDKVETWGAAGSPAYGPATGAGAGAFSLKNNVAAAVGQAINLMVGAAGAKATGTATAGAVGGDTWFGGTSYATSLCAAKGGSAGVRNGTAAIPGGQASAGIGDVKYSGGQGGASNGSSDGGGGGGAAGPQGNGKDGATGGKAAGNGVGGDAADGAKGGLRNVPSPNTAAPTNGASADDGGAGGGGCSDDAGGAFDYAGNGGFPGGAAGGGQWNKSSGTSAGGQVRLSWTGKSTYPIKGNVFYNIGFAGLVNGEVQQFKVMEPCVLSAGLPGSDSTFVVAATAQAVYTLYRNGVAFATATIAAGATTATYTMANDVKCDKGDVIKVVGPATADTTLANGTFQLVGVLI